MSDELEISLWINNQISCCILNNHQNKHWQCAFLKITDIMQHYVSLGAIFNFSHLIPCFYCHKHSWRMSWYLSWNIQWIHAYKCHLEQWSQPSLNYVSFSFFFFFSFACLCSISCFVRAFSSWPKKQRQSLHITPMKRSSVQVSQQLLNMTSKCWYNEYMSNNIK